MTSSATATTSAVRTPWAVFSGEVGAIRPIGHSLRRVTCRGDAFGDFADNGWDQRIKIILPLPDTGFATFPRDPDWYEAWRQLPTAEQNPIRTYTVRAVRAELGEVDIDLVVHGVDGPASAWVAGVAVGDPVALVGPHAGFPGEHGGVEFTPPAKDQHLLLAGDETAQPAVAAILEQLPADACGTAVLEMPHPDDVIDLVAPAGVRIEWLVRGARPVGEPMARWFAEHAPRLLEAASAGAAVVPAGGASPSISNVFSDATDTATDDATDDATDEVVWDIADGSSGNPLQVWIAGEASMVTGLRRLLVRDLGVDRRAVSFMGYWRR